MASPAMPVINPFDTKEADIKYEEMYEKGSVLRVSVSSSEYHRKRLLFLRKWLLKYLLNHLIFFH